MKLKSKTKVINGQLVVSNKNNTKLLKDNYKYLVTALQKKAMNEKDMIELIKKVENINEAAASFELAGFIVEYQDYLDFDSKQMDIIE